MTELWKKITSTKSKLLQTGERDLRIDGTIIGVLPLVTQETENPHNEPVDLTKKNFRQNVEEVIDFSYQ